MVENDKELSETHHYFQSVEGIPWNHECFSISGEECSGVDVDVYGGISFGMAIQGQGNKRGMVYDTG